MGDVIVRRADFTDDHHALLDLAARDPFTKGASNPIYLGYNNYRAGKIYLAEDEDTEELLGFICFNHGTRVNYSSIYYMGVAAAARRRGVGRALLRHVLATSPHGEIVLLVMATNTGAQRFYRDHGFRKKEDVINASKQLNFRLRVTRARYEAATGETLP